MPKIKINQDRCKGCLLCITVCPKALIKQSKRLNKIGLGVVEFCAKDENSCTGCTFCAITCPECAIEVWK